MSIGRWTAAFKKNMQHLLKKMKIARTLTIKTQKGKIQI